MWARLIFALALTAGSGVANDLARARHYYDDAHYPDALAVYDEVLARADLKGPDRNEALFYSGVCHLALDQEASTRQNFQSLLILAPAYVLPNTTSPKVRVLFEKIRGEVRRRPGLVAHGATLIDSATSRRAIRVSFTAINMSIFRPVVWWRLRPQSSYARVPLEGDGELTTDLLLPVSDSSLTQTIDYYGELRDGTSVVARTGSPDLPFTFQTSPQQLVRPTPVYARWWLWTSIGVVVAGGAAAAIYFATRPPSGGTLDLTIGTGR